MYTAAHRRGPSPALLAMLVVLGLPALAQAQLFPNLAVKRQRPPCAMEDPIYRVYRQQFYGYYPTQWRTFPPGWNLMSPEAVSPAQLEEARRSIQKEIDATAPSPDETDEPGATDEEPDMPDAPPTNPRNPIPLPPRGDSPFDLKPGPPADPGPLPGADAPRASRPSPSSEGLAVADPLDTAPPLADPDPSSSVESDSPPALPPLDGAVSPGVTYAPRDDDMPALADTSIVPPPAPAPRRKTLIGGLFDTMRGKRRR